MNVPGMHEHRAVVTDGSDGNSASSVHAVSTPKPAPLMADSSAHVAIEELGAKSWLVLGKPQPSSATIRSWRRASAPLPDSWPMAGFVVAGSPQGVMTVTKVPMSVADEATRRLAGSELLVRLQRARVTLRRVTTAESMSRHPTERGVDGPVSYTHLTLPTTVSV